MKDSKSTLLNSCALDALLKLNEVLALDYAYLIREAYESEKSLVDNTINTRQMKRILDKLKITYSLRKKRSNVSELSLIYLKYKDDPKGIKHWVIKFEGSVYDSIPVPASMRADTFYRDNPNYVFSTALNLIV